MDNKEFTPQSEIIIYQTDNGNIKIDVKVEDETVWLTQQQMAELFQTSRTNVVEYIVKGFTLDDERLKGNSGGNYLREQMQKTLHGANKFQGRFPCACRCQSCEKLS